MWDKPNQNQRVYLSAVIQTIAVGQFVWMGTPALNEVFLSKNLPTSISNLAISIMAYGILTLVGYYVLNNYSSEGK